LAKVRKKSENEEEGENKNPRQIFIRQGLFSGYALFIIKVCEKRVKGAEKENFAPTVAYGTDFA